MIWMFVFLSYSKRSSLFVYDFKVCGIGCRHHVSLFIRSKFVLSGCHLTRLKFVLLKDFKRFANPDCIFRMRTNYKIVICLFLQYFCITSDRKYIIRIQEKVVLSSLKMHVIITSKDHHEGFGWNNAVCSFWIHSYKTFCSQIYWINPLTAK